MQLMLRRLRYDLIDLIKQYPALYLPAARRFKRDYDGSDRAVSADTELVIEAYPRTASTFACVAFALAQPRPVLLAHHLHASAQVVAAARLGIPALVIIRQPEQAVLSFMVRAPMVTARQAFFSYLRFYRRLQPLRRYFVLARFETVTSDFGKVIAAVNRRFGTRFIEFEHTPENERAVFELLDQLHDRLRPKNRAADQTSSRPNLVKQHRKEQIAQQLERHVRAPLRSLADGLFQQLVQGADV